MISLEDFKKQILKVKGPRQHKVNKSYGVYDAYKYYRKIKPKDKKYILTESQYFAIIRNINIIFKQMLLEGKDITFPSKMGRLIIRKYNPIIKFEDGKIKTNLHPDWQRTLKLWFEDEESRKKKTILKAEEKELFKIQYDKSIATFNNKMLYYFQPNRQLKIELKNKIKEDSFDTFLFNY